MTSLEIPEAEVAVNNFQTSPFTWDITPVEPNVSEFNVTLKVQTYGDNTPSRQVVRYILNKVLRDQQVDFDFRLEATDLQRS